MSSYCDSLVQLHGLLSSQPAPIPLLQPVGGGDSLRQATSGRNSCQTPTRGSNLTLPGKPESRSPWGPGYWFLKAPSGKNKLSRDPQKKKKKKKGVCVCVSPAHLSPGSSSSWAEPWSDEGASCAATGQSLCLWQWCHYSPKQRRNEDEQKVQTISILIKCHNRTFPEQTSEA